MKKNYNFMKQTHFFISQLHNFLCVSHNVYQLHNFAKFGSYFSDWERTKDLRKKVQSKLYLHHKMLKYLS